MTSFGASYDSWLLRGSGAFSTERDYDLDTPCSECGTEDGILYVDDFGQPSLTCVEGHDQETPDFEVEPPEYEPEFDDDRYYADKYGE